MAYCDLLYFRWRHLREPHRRAACKRIDSVAARVLLRLRLLLRLLLRRRLLLLRRLWLRLLPLAASTLAGAPRG